jgi:oligopeptidase B
VPPLDPASASPPSAARIPRVDVIHGDRRVDDYHWLRDQQNPEVLRYLEAENNYTAAVMKPTEQQQEALYREMVGRIQETDSSAPYREGGHLYYHRTEQGLQYPIYCRRRCTPEAPEEITLDLNALAVSRPFMALGAYRVSDDGQLLAYSTDQTGFREYTLEVKELSLGRLLDVRIEKVASAAWAADNRTLFYTVEDAAKRPYRLIRHKLGDSDGVLIHEETDERFGLYVYRSRSRAFLFALSASHTTSETRFLSAGAPEGDWRIVATREQDHEYDVEHAGGSFYIRTNDRGRNFRLVAAPVERPGRSAWLEIVPHRPEVMLEGVELFARQAVLCERARGLPCLTVLPLDGSSPHTVSMPEPVFSTTPAENRIFDTTLFRFSYESPVTPPSVYDYDTCTRERQLIKQTPVLGGFDPRRYRCERLVAAAQDGAEIPVSLVMRADTPLDGTAALHLLGYGAYGLPLPVGFSSARLSLLERGVVCALAHVRGGGELGKPWHDAGRMRSKRNSFGDFISVAEHLIRLGYTRPERLGIEGRSAGGLLIAAVVNQRPDLFRAAVMGVPFVDVVNTMLDESLPLTVGEFEEWGNPKRKDEYDLLKSYSPYDNLAPRPYPAILIKTALHDSQVMYWEPAKYVARLRALKTDRNPLLLKTNLTAGHGGASGRYDHLRELAFDYAFLLSLLGADATEPSNEPLG